MERELEKKLIFLVEESFKSLGLTDSAPGGIALDIPTDPHLGDYASNAALKLASLKKVDPLQLAQKVTEHIKKKIADDPIRNYLKDVKAEGRGFINFYLNNEYFYEYLAGVFQEKEGPGKINLGNGEKVLIEFVSANPTGSLSVAHARQAAVGDALANILNFVGYEVKKEYYLNDEGNQINILGDSIALRLKELRGEKIQFPENYYQGEYIVDLAKRIKEENLKVDDFSQYGMGDILNTIKKELIGFGVSFDSWYSQKELRMSGKIQKALDFLKSKELVYEQDGALWFKSTLFKDDKDRVVIKSDGSYTYLAPDIAYHQDKYERGFKRLVNLWGPDHHGYINRLKASCAALGYNPDSLFIVIVQLATIFRGGEKVEMSTRKGQYITLSEVLDEVGLDASRFFFMMRKTSSHLDFDLEVAKKQTPENPVYYIQYAYARISSILEKDSPRVQLKDADLRFLREKEEIELIRKLWQFSYTLKICSQTLDPYMLTVYLQELAELFHRFYDRHRVLGSDARLTLARMVLVLATRNILDCGLMLLGISRPKKM